MTPTNPLFAMIRTGCLWLASLFIIATATAQTLQPIDSRFLFIFSTSAEMKARVPNTQSEVNTLFSTAMHGQMHAHDTLGVWTVGPSLHMGQVPLMMWNPNDAAAIAGTLNKFIARQTYARNNDLSTLQPWLDQVIATSPRLTVLIFCDGNGPVVGTPYDDEINRVFKQRFADLKRNKQPIVVVLRTQKGRYVGSSVNFPPGMVSLPDFPPYPVPLPPVTNTPAVAPAAPVAPVAPMTPLLMVGTRVVTNQEQFEAEKKSLEKARAQQASSNRLTSVGAGSKTQSAGANTGDTNAVAGETSSKRAGTAALVAGLLLAAAALTGLLIFRSRQAERGSLISQSQKK